MADYYLQYCLTTWTYVTSGHDRRLRVQSTVPPGVNTKGVTKYEGPQGTGSVFFIHKKHTAGTKYL